MKTTVLRILMILLILANMTAIFCFSAQKANQSSETSADVIKHIITAIDSNFDSLSQEAKTEKINLYQKLIRKTAHMSEYALLGFLCAAFALTFDFKKRNPLFAFLFCSLYASSDEFHQLFVEGRSCQLTDVLIDSAGAAIGISVCLLAVLLGTRFIRKKRSEKELVLIKKEG